MRLDERKFAELSRRLPEFGVVLLHGDDPVLIGERAAALTASLSSGDMFGAIELDGLEHALALRELNSPMLGGGGRLVRLRGAADAAAPTVERALAGEAGGLLLVEAGALTARSRLRSLVEKSERGMAMLCRGAEPRDLEAAIDRTLAGLGVRIDADARAALALRAGGHGAAVREAEKAALLVGDGGPIRLADVAALDGAGAAAGLDEACFAASCGMLPAMDVAIEALLADGIAPVALVRSLLTHMARVRGARLAVDGGAEASEAVASLAPPVFFRRQADMRGSVTRWSADSLDAACSSLWRADLQCRRTGSPATALCRAIAGWVAAGPSGGPSPVGD